MCGNAACCISTYAKWMSLSPKTFLLGKETVSPVANGGIALKKSPVPIADYHFPFNGHSLNFTLIRTGVPHGVIECPAKNLVDFEDKETLKKIAQNLRFKNPQDKKGMNVSFFQMEKPNRLKAITYERGVEDFTLACGTGALAVTFVYLHKHKIKNLKTVFVNMPGGELKVQIKPKAYLFSPVKKGYYTARV